MENIILIIHVFIAVLVVGLIMLQQGKGADVGSGLGASASKTIFGSSGKANFLSRLTAIAATVFFVTSLSLTFVAKSKKIDSLDEGIPIFSEEIKQKEQNGEDAPANIEKKIFKE